MITIVKQYVEMEFGFKEAKQAVEYNILEGQRELKSKHIQKLEAFIQTKNIRPFDISYAIVKVSKLELKQCGFIPEQFITLILEQNKDVKDDEEITFMLMVNGQHSANAIIKAKKHKVPVHGTYFECTTLQDVISVYARYDGDNLVKTLEDYLWLAIKLIVYNHGNIVTKKPNRLNPFQKIPSLLAIKAMIRINSQTRLSKSEKTQLVPNFLPQIIDINNLLVGTNSLQAKLSYLKVVEIILRSYKEDRNISIQFWTEVRDKSGPNNGPTWKFRNYYDSIQWRGGKAYFQNITPFDIRIFESMVLMAWTHFKNGTKMPKDLGAEHMLRYRSDLNTLNL